jgi:ribosomal protein S18 acetylase RimI-like enzyme
MIFAELVPPSTSNWGLFGEQIYKIEENIFGKESLKRDMLELDINDPKTVLVLLKDDSCIVGFTYATPESDGVARIVDTVIVKEYQGKGLVSKLMVCLEAELKGQKYEYITRDVMIENGYANKVEKNYISKIVEMKDLDSQWGKQRHFKIRI